MRIYLLAALFATGCIGTIGTGGGTGGGGDDDGTAPPPPAPTSVQVTVRDGNAPQAGVDVLFQNSDGSVVLETTTDATGVATATMAAGNVTVARTFPAPTSADTTQRDPEVYTYVGVQAGDALVIGDPTDDTDLAPSAINVKVPTAAQGTVKVVAACGTGQGTAPTVPMTVDACPSTVTFFVQDGGQNAFVAQAPYGTNVDLSGGDLRGTLATTFASSDLSPDMSSVSVTAYAMDGTYALYTSTSKRVDTTPQTVNLPDLQGIDELVVATVSSQDGTQMVASRQPYAVTPTTVDASANLLPYVSSPSYKSTGITWTETGTGTADFVVSTLAVTPNGGGTSYTRYIVAPYTSMALAIPTLAGADAIYNPAAMDQLKGTLGLVAAPGGYATARALAFSTPSIGDAAPMNGTVTLSYAGNTAPAL